MTPTLNRLRRALLLAPLLLLPACASTPVDEADRSSNFIARQHPGAVRLLNWNVRLSSIVGPTGVRQAPFARIVRATQPDIVVLQEIMLPEHRDNLRSAMQTLQPGTPWQAHAVSDNLVLSRFPLLRRGGAQVIRNPVPRLGLDDFHLGHAEVLIDIPAAISSRDLYLVAIHNKSRGGRDNIARRERHSDTVAQTLRALRNDGLQPGTAIVIAGDLNVLAGEADDPQRHLTTLLTGDIVDETRFGPDFAPDWDDSALADLLPSHNGEGQQRYTWRIDQTPYPPGALDRIIFTDSVMHATHSFVLNTTTMSDDELERTGLRRDDVLYDAAPGYFDHLPVVVDFKLAPAEQAL